MTSDAEAYLAILIGLGGSASQVDWDLYAMEKIQLQDESKSINYYRTLRTQLSDLGIIRQVASGVWSLSNKIVRGDLELNDSKPALFFMPADENINEGARQSLFENELIGSLENASPSAFERICRDLLRSCGFVEVDVTNAGADGGIDGHGLLRIALINFTVTFQCKRYRSPVCAPDIRDFRGAMSGRTEKGIFFTTSRFTRDAEIEARRPGAQPVDLVDGVRFRKLMTENSVGVQRKESISLSIDRDYFRRIEESD